MNPPVWFSSLPHPQSYLLFMVLGTMGGSPWCEQTPSNDRHPLDPRLIGPPGESPRGSTQRQMTPSCRIWRLFGPTPSESVEVLSDAKVDPRLLTTDWGSI